MLDGVAENTMVLPYNDPAALEDAIEKSDGVAAVIIEPVIANMGLIPPEKGFLDAVRKITQQSGVLLIFDEVVTGFRLALGGAQEFYNVMPDIATFAKAIANGFPIAAIAGKREVMERLSPAGRVYQASTFAGNPVSVAASLATLRTLVRRRNTLYPKLSRRCEEIAKGIRDCLSSLKFEAAVNSLGSMFQIFFTDGVVRDYESVKRSDVKLFKRFFDHLLREEGVFIPPSQFETCFLSYSHSADDLKRTVHAFENALKKVKG
ncbi:MAG: aspartate aminotransferase family protein, partial [Nitrososphaerales archaeon]